MESSENEFFGISINEYVMYIIHFTGFSLLDDKLLVLWNYLVRSLWLGRDKDFEKLDQNL